MGLAVIKGGVGTRVGVFRKAIDLLLIFFELYSSNINSDKYNYAIVNC